ncbi:hypothetical protein WEI85_18040 [Actinomycetes bacterium KLBMP 9797]
MAELLLLADPSAISVRPDGVSLHVDFDSIAELRSWLDLAGLNTPDLLISEDRDRTTKDGRPYRSLHAYPTWHGWEIYAAAIEYPEAPPLDPETTEQLAALAASGGNR